MKVYFLRHGESEYNLKKLINEDEKIKVPLTKKGGRQALKVAKELKKVNFDLIICSPFERCVQTAKAVNKFQNKMIILDERVGEARIGFEGKKEVYYEKFVMHDLINIKLKGKESFKDVVKRVENFLNWLKKEKYENVLVVTHDWLLRAANKIVNEVSYEEAYTKEFANSEYLCFEL